MHGVVTCLQHTSMCSTAAKQLQNLLQVKQKAATSIPTWKRKKKSSKDKLQANGKPQ